MLLLAIALGGATGALARHALSGWAHAWLGMGFPWGTLLVNVAGSFLLGVTLRVLEASTASPELRGLLIVGLLGAFTTFSTYAYETLALLEAGAWARAALYAGGSVLLGVCAVAAGFAAAVAIPARG